MVKIVRKSISLVMAVTMLLTCLCLGCYASAVGTVSGLKVKSVTATEITLQWSKVSGAKSYRVYRYNNSSKKWQAIKNVTTLKYADTGLDSGKEYAYKVRAVATENKKQVLGKSSATVKAITKPATVTNLKASSVSQNSVKLTWSKTNGATGYAVYRYDSSTKKYSYVGKTTSRSYTVKNLTPATSYTFSVRSYTEVQKTVYGAYSKKLTAKTKDPTVGKVSGLKLYSVKDNGFRISWNKLSGATGYQVAVYDTAEKKWKAVMKTSNNYADITLKDTNAYKYSVRAYVKANSKDFYGSYATGITAFSKPAVPKKLQGAENSNSGITLKWNKVSGADGYQVYSYDPIHGDWLIEGSSTTNSYTVKGLKETSHYKYKVRAYRLSGKKKFYGDFCESVTVAYNSGTNDSIYSEAMEQSGVFGYLYDPTGKYFYTADDPWQRNFGYNSVFDTAAPLSLIGFDTTRLRFEYGDKDWMIQLWRGQYGLIFYGAEVGVYTKPKNRKLMHYDCASDDEMLKMSMVFNEYKSGEWQKRFTRPYGYYWWCTGFLPGNKYGRYDTIRLDMRITVKDYDMLSGIKGALDNNNMQYTVKGLDVYFSY